MDSIPDKNTVLQAISGSGGIKSTIAGRLGCNLVELKKILSASEDFEQAIEDARYTLVDFAETKLYQKVKDDHWPSIRFVLETLGKERGYYRKEEKQIEQKGQLTLEFCFDEDFQD